MAQRCSSQIISRLFSIKIFKPLIEFRKVPAMTKKRAGKANDEYYNTKKKTFLNVKNMNPKNI